MDLTPEIKTVKMKMNDSRSHSRLEWNAMDSARWSSLQSISGISDWITLSFSKDVNPVPLEEAYHGQSGTAVVTHHLASILFGGTYSRHLFSVWIPVVFISFWLPWDSQGGLFGFPPSPLPETIRQDSDRYASHQVDVLSMNVLHTFTLWFSQTSP